jgi:tRNA (guanine37-N1)-methyltransferase
MVMKPQPLMDAIEAAQANADSACKVIHLTPEGQPINQDNLQRLSQENDLILIAGRYEGIDERVVKLAVDEQYSIGDFVLTGGEIPAMALIDGITRLLPGALGDEQSALQDSFQNGLLDCPHFTRPQTYRNLGIPDILLSGDHQAISNWRHKKSLQRTWQKRPDLLKNRHLSAKERQWLDEFQQRGQNDEQNN